MVQSLNGKIYGLSWYLDVVCEGWNALIEGDYETVMPLTAKIKWGIHYLCQPYYAQQLGVFSKKEVLQQTVRKFLEAIPNQYQFIEINLNAQNIIEADICTTKENCNIELDLSSSYDDISKSYSENTKRNIKKAIKNEVRISKEESIEGIIDIFKKNKGVKFPSLKEDSYEMLVILHAVAKGRGNVEVWSAYNKTNTLCGGVVFMKALNRNIFLFSAINQEGKEIGAMSYLIDRFIAENANQKALLDFEGSNDPTLARFYKSFGADELKYLQIKWNRLPWWMKWLKN